MKNNEKPERARKFTLIAYGTRFQIEQFVNTEFDKLNEGAFILHDKDEVEPHWHIYLNYINATTFERVKQKLHKITNQNVMTEEVISTNGIMAYMTHENAPEKWQYDKEEVTYRARDKPNIWLNMYIDYVELRLPVKTMISKYGKEFTINIRNFRDLRTEKWNEDEREARAKNIKLKELNEDETRQLEMKLNFKGDN